MTAKCKKHCSYKVNAFETKVFDCFGVWGKQELADTIKSELQTTGCDILTWFATGDCPEAMTGKITVIMALIEEAGFIQCGFTRNRKLWKWSQNLPNTRLGLTVESKVKAIKLSEEGLISLPDYDSWTITLFQRGKAKYNCGGGFGATCGEAFVIPMAEEVYPEDCGQCYTAKRGCFL
jgi:hypothetical protein